VSIVIEQVDGESLCGWYFMDCGGGIVIVAGVWRNLKLELGGFL
jgi:hypothetical protein